MASPEGSAEAKFEGDDRRKGADRRTGGDRRSGDDRRTGISLSRSTRRPTFLDHPWWVAATIVVGIALGMGIMSATDWFGKMHRVTSTEMTVLPDATTKDAATPAPTGT